MSDIAYLDRAATTAVGQAYKRRLLAAMELGASQSVLDVGCGPGTDLADMATLADRVIGVDHDAAMVAETQRRYAGAPAVEVRLGDAHALPVPDDSVDRVRLDRVVQHLADPALAMAEARRVLRPGGLAAFADPDWDTLAIDDEDLTTSRAYTRYVTTEVVRNATVGRGLARLADRAGLRVCSVDATAVTFTDHAAAAAILRMPQVAERAVGAGFLEPAAAAAWLHRLATAPTFLASFTFYIVAARRPE